MEQEQSREKYSLTPKWLNRVMVGVMLPMMSYMGWMMKDVVPDAYREIKQQKYAIEHLDTSAVSPKESPFVNNFSRWGGVVYEDPDKDGDYDSILKRKNSDGEFVEIPIKKGLEGKIEFVNLSETAVDPLSVPKNPWGLKLDYMNVDGDDRLESIIYFGLDDDTSQRMKIELVNGKYVLSDI